MVLTILLCEQFIHRAHINYNMPKHAGFERSAASLSLIFQVTSGFDPGRSLKMTDNHAAE